MSKIRSRLPGTAAANNLDVDSFINAADAKNSIIGYIEKIYPWEEVGVRGDVYKVYNLRLPEAYLMKLKYIAEHTPDSMQKFCLKVLQDAIDDKIKELLQK